MAHALSFIKTSIHHFLQAHLRSQRRFSCHNRWSNALAARRPTFVKASSTISLSITAVCSSGRHGIGGILHFHVGIDKDSDCTIIGLYSFKSHGITCNFLLCLEFQQNWVCKEKGLWSSCWPLIKNYLFSIIPGPLTAHLHYQKLKAPTQNKLPQVA